MKSSIIKTLLYALSLLLTVSCDTTEDAYWPGGEPATNEIFTVGVDNINFNADSLSQSIEIRSICRWIAEIDTLDNVFTLSSYSGEGNATIIVTPKLNTTSNERKATLSIKSVEFDKKYDITLRQSAIALEMPPKTYKVIKESGDTINLIPFKSTVDWYFELERSNEEGVDPIGDIKWLKFNSNFKGNGDYVEQKISVTFEPNYTLNERYVNFKLVPKDRSIRKFITEPQDVMLRQYAGTLPFDIKSDEPSVDKTTIEYKFSFKSMSDVKDCGVKTYADTINNNILETIPATSSAGMYNEDGKVSVKVENLEKGAVHYIRPYVVNMVGEAVGKAEEIITKDDPEGIKNIFLLNSIECTERGVTANVKIESDIDIYETKGCFYKNVDDPNVQINKTSVDMEKVGEIWKLEASGLTPNTEYILEVSAKISDENVKTKEKAAQFPFETLPLIPDASDNPEPEIKF